MEYSDLIKNFSTTREYLRDFYIYGFRKRKEYAAGSARKYDNERRRAEDWLRGILSFHADASGKSYFISVDSRVIPENPLFAAFKSKSFTDYDISLHFYILDALSDGGEHSLRQIADGISRRWMAVPGAPDVPDDATVRNKLNEYARLGILRARREKRAMLYALLPALEHAEACAEGVSFASEMLPLGVIGSFLLDAWGRRPSFLSYKHRYLPGALDSEALLALVECRNRRICARLRRRSAKKGGMAEDLVYPLRIFLGTQTGRSYLLAWSIGEKRMHAYRLDRIEKVSAVPDDAADAPARFSKSAAEEKSAGFQKSIWGVAFGKKISVSHLQRVSMTVHAGPGEGYVVQRLQREKRCGSVTQVDEHTWRFDAEVCDAMEMLPWLRTFMGRITALECSNPEVARRFHDDLGAMLRRYGEDGDALP